MPGGARVVITGATSGIGEELVRQYASDGDAVLGIVGRRRERLEQIAAEARAQGAEVLVYALDVCDREGMQAMAADFLEWAGGIDLVIANAGVSLPDRPTQGDPGPAAKVIDVNVIGAINTLVPFLPRMKEQRSGQIVGVASVASYQSLPIHGAYSASKVALRYLLRSWDFSLRRHGIVTTVLNPGFVTSEMTDSLDAPQPFKLSTAAAVQRMRWAIAAGKLNYTFPIPMRIATWIMPWLPRWIVARLR